MAEQASDFLKNYQALAQQSWDAWTRQLQQQQPAANPFFTPPVAPASGNDTLERTLAGLKGYFDLMQGAAASSGAGASGDWRQQLQQMFGGASQPFAQAFGGIDTTGAEGFGRQWQSWLQAAQHSGFGDLPGAQHGPTPAFGLNREQQMQQEAMSAAVLASLQASARYHALIQRANAQGMEKLQSKLAQHAEPGHQVDSLKALYDLWVDAVEEAYAEIALSDEFREAYGEMVNTQMRVRQHQQKQTEQMCQQLGVPTRSEVSSLGERLQQLRREVRGKQPKPDTAQADEITELRRELNALKRQLAASGNRTAVAPAAKSTTKSEISAVKKTATKAPAPPLRKVAVKTLVAKKTAATNKSPAAAGRANPRKRK